MGVRGRAMGGEVRNNRKLCKRERVSRREGGGGCMELLYNILHVRVHVHSMCIWV